MNTSRILDSEWEVMKAVWDHEPLTAVEVLNHLPHDQSKQKTVNTFMTRLETKGVIRAERVGRPNVYRSLISEKQCRGMAGSQFLKKVFRGEAAPLMLHFIENGDLSKNDIAELKQMLEKRHRPDG